MSTVNLSYLQVLISEEPNFFWKEIVIGVSMTQLAIFSVAPGVHFPLAAHCHSMLPPTRHLNYGKLDQGFDRCRYRVVFSVSMT